MLKHNCLFPLTAALKIIEAKWIALKLNLFEIEQMLKKTDVLWGHDLQLER